MNNNKIYFSLLGAFVFQIIAFGIFNTLLKESFFTINNLVMAVVATTSISFFVLKKNKKTQK